MCTDRVIERGAYGFLELGVFFLGVDEVEGDVEYSDQHQGQEKGEPSEVCVALGAKASSEIITERDGRRRRTRTSAQQYLCLFEHLVRGLLGHALQGRIQPLHGTCVGGHRQRGFQQS